MATVICCSRRSPTWSTTRSSSRPRAAGWSLTVQRQGGDPVIRVADTGSGITQGECESVTKRFYRSDRSRSTKGLGLGLSLVAAIVKLHGFRFAIALRPRLHGRNHLSARELSAG